MEQIFVSFQKNSSWQKEDGKLKKPVIGVLALQGDFSKHASIIKSLGYSVLEVRKPQELEACQALVIPGGESTVMLKQLEFIKMREKLCRFAKEKPVFGTCAGLILMSTSIQDSTMVPLGLLDVTVERNAYGRQIASFEATIQLHSMASDSVPAFFIRAPRIIAVGDNVKILGTYEGEPVLVKQGHLLGASFHPELTTDLTIYEYFLNCMVKV